MMNLKPQILKLLQEIKEAKQVSYYYPAEWADNKLPSISYYEAKNRQNETVLDDGEYDSEIAFVIDIWAKSSGICSTIAVQVNDKLQSLGLRREFSGDLFESETGIHHKSMRFSCVVNLKTSEIY